MIHVVYLSLCRMVGNDKWLEAYKDPVASLYTLTQCICLSDVQADGDWKLIIADLGTGSFNMKLKVYKGEGKVHYCVLIAQLIAQLSRNIWGGWQVSENLHKHIFNSTKKFSYPRTAILSTFFDKLYIKLYICITVEVKSDLTFWQVFICLRLWFVLVWLSGTNLMSEHTIIDLPTGVVSFYMDTHEPRTPGIHKVCVNIVQLNNLIVRWIFSLYWNLV